MLRGQLPFPGLRSGHGGALPAQRPRQGFGNEADEHADADEDPKRDGRYSR
jgi:hypothetical protein